MDSIDSLYNELKPDINRIANVLFELSEKSLRKRGGFLPHAAFLTNDNEISLFSAMPDDSKSLTNSTKVLPLLHEGLRQQVRDLSIRAIGIAEDVTITLEGKPPSKAIKVLFEHKRGLVVVLYLPYARKLFGGYVLGIPTSLPANPEVNAWS